MDASAVKLWGTEIARVGLAVFIIGAFVAAMAYRYERQKLLTPAAAAFSKHLEVCPICGELTDEGHPGPLCEEGDRLLTEWYESERE